MARPVATTRSAATTRVAVSPARTAMAVRAPTPENGLERRIWQELETCIQWCFQRGVVDSNGYPRLSVDEVGIPNNTNGDAAQWNDTMDRYMGLCDAYRIPVYFWGEVSWRSSFANPLTPYRPAVEFSTPIVNSDTMAPIYEKHLAVPGAPTWPAAGSVRRGINANAAALHSPFQQEATSVFSNTNPNGSAPDNTYYGYDPPSTWSFLFGKGYRTVRLGVRWERLQPTLGGAFNATEQSRLQTAITDLTAAGLACHIQLFNFGAYYRNVSGTGTRTYLGSANLTEAHFIDLWDRLSTLVMGSSGVLGYDLMNEPDSAIVPLVWESAVNAAIAAIRGNGDTKEILVPRTDFNMARYWPNRHNRHFVVDSGNNFRYSVHQYFDRFTSGAYVYPNTYASEVAYTEGLGF